MKKNLLTIVILALLLVNIALTAVMMISVTTTNNATSALVKTIATVMNLELVGDSPEGEVEPVSLADTEVYAIQGTMTIPLKVEITADGKEKQVHMVVDGISLQINKTHEDYKTMNALVSTNESLIKDAIRTVIASKTEDECRNDEAGLKAEILKEIHNLFESDFIYGIVFSDVKFG
ncbi:MAG: flagellar basal body-associated FliL family protein [Lachnospiraceae bacterium]|nr:flagellar basal body-associated FliL family protein [Lachnospiraceae bacterium]